MAIKSNNEQGNKYHDENTGKFTSAEGGSSQGKRFKSSSELARALGWKPSGDDSEVAAGEFLEMLEDKGVDLDFWEGFMTNPKIARPQDVEKMKQIKAQIDDIVNKNEEAEAMRIMGLNKTENPAPVEKKKVSFELPIVSMSPIEYYEPHELEHGIVIDEQERIDYDIEDLFDYFASQGVELSEAEKNEIYYDEKIDEDLLRDYYDEEEFAEFLRERYKKEISEAYKERFFKR